MEIKSRNVFCWRYFNQLKQIATGIILSLLFNSW